MHQDCLTFNLKQYEFDLEKELEIVKDFNKWLGSKFIKKRYKHIIVISGNHEIVFNGMKFQEIQKLLSNCIFKSLKHKNELK